MRKPRPIVLKIGGSVITEKKEELKASTGVIDRLADEVSRANLPQLLVVHGGGSFGHPIAERYHIKEGFKEDSQKIRFCETHQMMTVLNGLLMDSLLWHSVPAMAITPSSVAVTKKGRINVLETISIQMLLDMGITPVMYGDAVLDSDLGFTILSGDQLASMLAIKFGAERIVMGVDVDGLFDTDPKTEKRATMYERLSLRELSSIQGKLDRSSPHDVTGGMAGKISELILAIEAGISVLIVNASKPGNVYSALQGKAVTGTLIEKE